MTCIAFGVRAQNPHDFFWTPFAFCAGLFSFLMFFITQSKTDFDSKKEPLYFVFNGFALLCVAFPFGMPMTFYNSTLALMAMIASLFFVVTKKHVPHGKFTQLDADNNIMETLDRKRKRTL
ncbi:MAG: hypothetical protein COS88_05730 [Chloroflexi bacterium CG07_land_8_20_14_0_80_51_10]|nr:MAG: hypothetical protein COS88_05730 [Chloroflexi bacterium CG07_land_8_20_14_0_80_51_10]